MIFMPASNEMWFGLSDSFWGALFGAGVSGLFAILVFALGKHQENKNRRKYLNSVKWLLNHVHENINNKIDAYIENYSAYKDMPDKVRFSIPKIIENESYLKYIEYNNLLIEPQLLKNSIKYVGAFKSLSEVIKNSNYKDYGYHMGDIEKIKMNYDEMKESIKLINKE
ncbi:hypothetical protein [Planococcus rifietoensis]|uniref:hypothetical protein n=1 Tax=Planococcus rifietoensis TaxID=200991 RepID=UPI00384B1134